MNLKLCYYGNEGSFGTFDFQGIELLLTEDQHSVCVKLLDGQHLDLCFPPNSVLLCFHAPGLMSIQIM